MKTLYPEIEPFDTGRLTVSPIHELYYEQCGNPDGQPVVYLHGGPGAGLSTEYRRFFDPEVYRIVLFDQRGCGKSTPYASLEDNTTWHLVSDIEQLRTYLGIDQWQVFGGSWGSTLALAYAETHPDRVTQLILRGIYLGRRDELEWFFHEGLGRSAIFPDYWEDFVGLIPKAERNDLLSAYHRRFTDSDESVRFAAARAWAVWEGCALKLILDQKLIDEFTEPQLALPLALLECHYFMNDCFFSSANYLIENVDRIRHIPGVIVHGRYDTVCPITSGWELHRAWPEAELVIVPDASHSVFEPGIIRALVEATDRFRG
ncbi:MAG: prolyl aminopeptidase [Pyrinomonadaceae bacterium]